MMTTRKLLKVFTVHERADDLGGRKKRFVKDPNVDTSFLPDREREEREREEREDLRKEWLAKQEHIKTDDVEITYSYWDGSGHRKSVEVRRHTCYSRPWLNFEVTVLIV